jgi:hypothetical protein
LDGLPGHVVTGHPVGAGFDRLQLLVQHGYRLVFRTDSAGCLEVVHVDATPDFLG